MVSNLSENVWYLVAVGGLGMVQNLFAAGHCRDPSALGIHLDKSDTVLPDKPEKDKNGAEIKNKVFQVLKKTEKRMSETYGVRKVGILLLPVFFPDGLRPHEIAWRREEEAKYDKIDEVAGIYKRDENEKHSDGPKTSGKIGQDSAWAERPSSGAIAHRHRHAAEHSKETVQDAV